jgi:predicted phage terminase large subunit-like protein
MPDYRILVREVFHQRMQFPDLTGAIEDMARRYNNDLKLRGVVIEDKGSGTSAYQTLMQASPDWLKPLLIPFQPMGSKEYRAAQASVWARNSCIMLPTPNEHAPWLSDFEAELFGFPSAAHDDQVDSFTQAILYLEHFIAEGFRARAEVGQAA